MTRDKNLKIQLKLPGIIVWVVVKQKITTLRSSTTESLNPAMLHTNVLSKVLA